MQDLPGGKINFDLTVTRFNIDRFCNCNSSNTPLISRNTLRVTLVPRWYHVSRRLEKRMDATCSHSTDSCELTKNPTEKYTRATNIAHMLSL